MNVKLGKFQTLKNKFFEIMSQFARGNDPLGEILTGFCNQNPSDVSLLFGLNVRKKRDV